MISSMFQVSVHPQNDLLGYLKNVPVISLFICQEFFLKIFKNWERNYLAKETSLLKLNGIFRLICVN